MKSTTTHRPSQHTAQRFLTLLLLVALFTSCDSLSDSGDNAARKAVLTANEGNFSEGNGSVSWFDPEEGTTLQRRFEQVNQRPLGGIIQSVTRTESHLYIVTNSPDKIEKVSLPDLEHEETLTTDEPAFTPVSIAIADESTAYVSSLYDHSVYRIDPGSMTVESDPISTGNNPQALLITDQHLFVANNGFGNDETVSVIDIDSDQVVETLTVGAGPLQMDLDDTGRLWILSAGRTAYDEDGNRVPEEDLPGRIDLVDSEDVQVTQTIDLEGNPAGFALDFRTGYAWVLGEDRVYRVGLDDLVVEPTELPVRKFQTIGVSPWESRLYLGQSRGYDQSGQVLIASPEGALIDSFQAGVSPVQIEFLELN
ncbi:MAG: YncE family protein [Bacteroidota bacterium]